MKGLPTGYNKDLQEDKEAFFKAFDNVRLCLSVLRLSVRTVHRQDGSHCRKLPQTLSWVRQTLRISL